MLILTKALGTGAVTTALKRRIASDSWVEAAQNSMMALNTIRDLIEGIPVHAATDVTGFGLAGHSLQVARASGVRLTFNVEALPALPGAIELLQDQVINRAHKTNGDYVASEVSYSGVPEHLRLLTVDPQTSGGLLLSVPADRADECVEKLRGRFPSAARVGYAVAPGDAPSKGPLVVFTR
jgi:selenide,water dikinase